MSGQNWVKRGTMSGTGAVINITCGFKPAKVELFNVDGLAKAEKTEYMDAAKSVVQITAGTMTYVDVITLTADGFSIGTDADLNVAGEDLHWVAWQAQND